MPLSASVQVALSILQIIGLLIPVVFLSLRSYFPEQLSDNPPLRTDGNGDIEVEEIDAAPQIIRLGWVVVGSLAAAGLFAAIRVLISVIGSWLVVVSTAFLALGLLALALIFYEIRSSMTIEVM